MRFWLCAVLPAILALCVTSENCVFAQARKPNPAFEKIVDDPKLPRVLIIGDSISMGYTIPVRKLLAGQANVHRISVNGGPTPRGVESIDAWLGDGKWDVIHFNWGLHDIRYMDDKEVPPGPLTATPPAPRHPQVSIEDYEKNLTQIVERLQKTGAKLIWRNTTPVPEGSVNRVPGDEVRYNAVAEKIMQSHGVQIEDLHSFVKPQISELMLPKNVHYTPAGYDALAEQVAATIKAALPAAQQ
ncbi:acyl-CoA thioesterase-1 [Planctomicrobium piriforme]|uniref:Acyl-CoA thioesterase-1 n=2 Tax=Planctomicrobium piriforme TaxID=1576369 RepID=A0A1I3RQF6_9PLAN|nr:acyl-CoA thioesterase-1 [Planctomicrobium piriforme]